MECLETLNEKKQKKDEYTMQISDYVGRISGMRTKERHFIPIWGAFITIRVGSRGVFS